MLSTDDGPLMLDWDEFKRSDITERGQYLGKAGGDRTAMIHADAVRGPELRAKISIAITAVHANANAIADANEDSIRLPAGTMCPRCRTPLRDSVKVGFVIRRDVRRSDGPPFLNVRFKCTGKFCKKSISIVNPLTREQIWAASKTLDNKKLLKLEEKIVAGMQATVKRYCETAGDPLANGWDPVGDLTAKVTADSHKVFVDGQQHCASCSGPIDLVKSGGSGRARGPLGAGTVCRTCAYEWSVGR